MNEESHKRELWRNRRLGLTLTVAGLILVGVMGWAVSKNRIFSSDVCESTNQSNEALRGVLLLSKAQSQRRQYEAIIVRDGGVEDRVVIRFPDVGSSQEDFYNKALALTRPISC